MPKDEDSNVRPLFADIRTPEELSSAAELYEERCKSSSIRDTVAQFQNQIAEVGDENIHGVICMVITKDPSQGTYSFTPSCYETDMAYAMTVATLAMLERLIHDEAENFRIEGLVEDCEDDL